jgi:hypothetical protein
MILPSVAVRAGNILGFDTLGQPAVGPNMGLLTSLLAAGFGASLSNIAWVTNVAAVRALTPPASPACHGDAPTMADICLVTQVTRALAAVFLRNVAPPGR